jgi:hypothetical protein
LLKKLLPFTLAGFDRKTHSYNLLGGVTDFSDSILNRRRRHH